MGKVELTHLLAYNTISLTHINVDCCGLSFSNCKGKKKLRREALGYEFVHELEDLKMPAYVISVGFNL